MVQEGVRGAEVRVGAGVGGDRCETSYQKANLERAPGRLPGGGGTQAEGFAQRMKEGWEEPGHTRQAMQYGGEPGRGLSWDRGFADGAQRPETGPGWSDAAGGGGHLEQSAAFSSITIASPSLVRLASGSFLLCS